MKRRLLYPYHFNFGTCRTQEHIKPRLITSYMDESAQSTTKQKNVQQKGNKTPYKQMKI